MNVDKISVKQANISKQKSQNQVVFKSNLNTQAKDEVIISGANDGKFTMKEALKNFGKGIISPIKAVIDHPFIAVGMIAATVGLCAVAPVLTPLMTVGFGALSIFEMGKGGYKAISEYRKGNYDNAEKAFDKIGSGFIGTVLTMLGLKQSAKTAAEIKAVNLKKAPLTKSEVAEISAKFKKTSIWTDFKENLSLITTKEGRAATFEALKPSNIIKNLKTKAQQLGDKFKPFEQTAEGQRRAKMSTRQLEDEVTKVINETFDEMGIPKEARPKIEIVDELRFRDIDDANKFISQAVQDRVNLYRIGGNKITFSKEFFKPGENLREMSKEMILDRIESVLLASDDSVKSVAKDDFFLQRLLCEHNNTLGGSYSSGGHTIKFNSNGYRTGVYKSIEEVASHEALHAKMAIYRNSLSKEEAASIVKKELMNRIVNGEAEEIVVSGNFMGPETMKPPKMTEAMKRDFSQFAEEFLYKTDDLARDLCYRKNRIAGLKSDSIIHEASKRAELQAELATIEAKLEPLLTRLKQMIDKNPEFVSLNGGNKTDAYELLVKYTLAHENRFNAFSNVEIKGIDKLKLTPEQHQLAVESLIGNIETLEGNARVAGINGFFAGEKGFNQYQFSYEELMARNTAAIYEKSKIENILKTSNLSAEVKAELMKRVDDLDFVLKYNETGKEFYQMYQAVSANPNDAKLAEEFAEITKVFNKLEAQKIAIRNGQNSVIDDYVVKIHGKFPINTVAHLPKKDN